MNSAYMQPTLRQSGVALLALKILAAALFLIVVPGIKAAGAEDAVTLKFNVNGSYTLGPGDPKTLAHKLALFRAKYKAASQAADKFARKKWIQFENGDRNELTALVAENLAYDIMADQWRNEKEQTTYVVDLQALVKLSDFIDAQLKILEMAHEKAREDLRHEMDPPLPELLKPGVALAKAHWLIRINEIRMAIIYLDGLIQQYPNWQEAVDVKKRALQHQHQLNAANEDRFITKTSIDKS